MATHNPLVLIGGSMQELPAGDTINGASGGASLGANTFTAAQEWPTGDSIASAATVNLDTATGNRVHITGTTTITAVTLTRGPRTVIFDGILTLTHHVTNNNLPGAANITTAAGDRCVYESDGTTVYGTYIKASGSAVVAASSNGGATETSSAIDITLTSASTRVQAVAMTASSKSVILPNATTLTTGGALFVVKNTGAITFAVRDSAGTLICPLGPGQIAALYLVNNSTSAGVWAAGNESAAPFLSAIFAGAILTVNAVSSFYTSVTALSATQAIVTYQGTSAYLETCTLNISGTTVTAGAVLPVNAVSSFYTSVTALSATQAIVTYQGTSAYLETCTLNISGTTVTAGAVLPVNAVSSVSPSVTALSATQAIVTYRGTSAYLQTASLEITP